VEEMRILMARPEINLGIDRRTILKCYLKETK
jgi:hypothetical protein